MKSIKVPGAVWAAILIGISYFLQANWPGEVWMQGILFAITGLLKFLEVQYGENYPDIPTVSGTPRGEVKQPSKWTRWAIG